MRQGHVRRTNGRTDISCDAQNSISDTIRFSRSDRDQVNGEDLPDSMQNFDFIIVGSGSAGAIVAARLAENRSCRVLVLEAGPRDKSLLFHVPAAMRHAYNAPKYNWNYQTEPEPYLNNRRLVQPRGRVLGGSSSINGQLYLRGHPLDYEGWARSGARGWSYADVLPYFKRLETRVDGRSEYRGDGGPIGVSTAEPGLLAQAFLLAGRQAGYRSTDDVNGFQQDGFGLLPKNVAGGRRSSTARCYLRNPPSNLLIQTRSTATRVLFENRRACGVEYRVGNDTRIALARREIAVCAGAFNSPLLLMESGIGPAEHLREFGIDVVANSPSVGANLMDHPLTSVQVTCRKPATLYRSLERHFPGPRCSRVAAGAKGSSCQQSLRCSGIRQNTGRSEIPRPADCAGSDRREGGKRGLCQAARVSTAIVQSTPT